MSVTTKIPTRELEELFTVPAYHVDKPYITLGQTSIRLTFVETIKDTQDIMARVAVSMNLDAAMELYNVLGQLKAMIDMQKQAKEPQDTKAPE